MGFFVMILAPLEMLIVNLFVIHICSRRKFGQVKTIVLMGLCIVVLLFLAYLIARNAPDFGSGNGLFVFTGFLFIIPIRLLYENTGNRIIIIACFSWTYTFLLFALSAILGNALVVPWMSVNGMTLLVQTFMYICTIRVFYKMLTQKFIYVLEHVGKKEANALMWVNMMWFWIAFIINLAFFYPGLFILQIFSVVTLAVCAASSFHYFYLQVDSGETIQNLEKIAYQDALTQLRSRVVMNSDAEALIERKIPFNLIFFDLNDFKSINDRFGHSVGDDYLAFFAHEIKIRLGNRGGFYRIAGDEFTCILSDKNVLEGFIADINAFPDTMKDTDVKFLGFSYGIATFPQDGDTINDLLVCADQHMYEMKRASKSGRGERVAVAENS